MPEAAAAASRGEQAPPQGAGAFAPADGDDDGEFYGDEEDEMDDDYEDSPPRVQLRSGPQPVDLWRAKHESSEPRRTP